MAGGGEETLMEEGRRERKESEFKERNPSPLFKPMTFFFILEKRGKVTNDGGQLPKRSQLKQMWKS